MRSTVTFKHSNFVFFLLCGVFLVALLAREFLPQPYSAYLLTLTSSALLGIFAIFSLTKTLKKSSFLTKCISIGLWTVIGAVLIHFLLNVVNVYQFEPLPAWFYQLKLFRLISLSSLFWIQLLVFFTLLSQSKNIPLLRPRWNSLALVAAVFMAVVLLMHTQQALAHTHQQLIQITQNLNTPFADRFTYRQGGAHYYGWIWPYSQFIIRHTPDSAVIMIPPQNNIWKMEGNEAYFRWFMHPRKLLTLQDGNIPEATTHVLIALGECSEGECGWPKIPIETERIAKIVLIDRETQNETTLTNISYELDLETYQWGIIELK